MSTKPKRTEAEHAKAIKKALQALRDYQDADREAFPEKVMDVAIELWAAKRDITGNAANNVEGLNANERFSRWLDSNGFDKNMDTHTRTALVNFGRYEEYAWEILETTTRRNLRLIWERELEPHLIKLEIIDPKDRDDAKDARGEDGGEPDEEQEAVKAKVFIPDPKPPLPPDDEGEDEDEDEDEDDDAIDKYIEVMPDWLENIVARMHWAPIDKYSKHLIDEVKSGDPEAFDRVRAACITIMEDSELMVDLLDGNLEVDEDGNLKPGKVVEPAEPAPGDDDD